MGKRFAHTIAPNHSSETVHSAIWFDTETDQIKSGPRSVRHVLRYGFAAFSRTRTDGTWLPPIWCRFTTANQFMAFVEQCARAKTRTYLFCHNSNFDVPVLDLVTGFQGRGWELKRAIIEGPPTSLVWRRDSVTLQLLDTLNFWRMPLAMIGKMVGTPKLPFPKPDDSPAIWDAYCRNDVQVIMDACQQWWTFLLTHDLGGFAITMAGQSLRAFRHRFMKHKIHVSDDEHSLAMARVAYTGGRVECFYVGQWKRKVWALDINSMYPYVMRANGYPTGRKTTYARTTIDRVRRYMHHYCVICDCTLVVTEPVFPLKHDGKLYFPVGTFRTCLSTPEMQYAMDHDMVRSIHYCTVYDKAPLFRGYVDYFYAMRLRAKSEGDETRAQMFKLLLNSLYGKFGQRGLIFDDDHSTVDTTITHYITINLDTGVTTKTRQFGGLVQVFQNDGESRESMPAIAAHVTAHARMYLWQLMQQAGRDHVLYCDTDCVWVDYTGYRRLQKLIHPTGLGRLKTEHAESGCLIRGPKDYVIGDVHKTKGARKTGVWLSDHVIQQERWDSLIGLLAKGRLSAPETHTVVKHFARVYGKGQVLPSGHVLPLQASDLLAAGATSPRRAP